MTKDYYGKECDFSLKTLFLFDMDGTVYNENTLFQGVQKLFARIVRRGGRYVFITNNSSRSVTDYLKKVRGMGVAAEKENFFTSAQASVLLLREKYGDGLIYAQGTKSFLKELKRGGLNVTCREEEGIRAVLVGFDPELTGEKLRTTCKILTRSKADYYATNPDWACPVDFGYVPDCGSMCFGIEKATGKKPTFIGKPSPLMIETVMKKFGADKEQTLVVGDRLYTDVASGVNAGVDTVLVLSGEATPRDLSESEVKPSYVLNGVWEIEI